MTGEKLLLFGVAGIPRSAERRSSVAGIARVRALGLDAMELQFVQRVAMSEESAQDVCQVARENGIRLSVHAPYYINFNSKDQRKLKVSRERLLKAARIAALCGAQKVVFHPAFYHDTPSCVVYERVRVELQSIFNQLKDEGFDVCLCPETTGKPVQFGDLDEILRLSAEINGVCPCIDFGHLHARSGGILNDQAGFRTIFDRVKQFLGGAALEDMHMHVQGMAYTKAGERKHLNILESDLCYEDLLRVLVDLGVRGTLICESPNLEDDALLLQRIYRRLCDKQREAIF